ncbi:MAG: hypothetical protein US29_C0005G0019 [candidate division WS6 bacterium GW2011_GWF1_36_8]|uniref:Uncharacterized protein n=1 Tax=candidate division WS6 bacterium GW2011_GWF1_36_8 TaxID=1619098 RepID=A0A0G0FJ28_9BACT|nr:MAG: hypothetical protein US29_C0005G0019 [candidate division WS6 bacterium GW2011_GWF1_36_8]MBU1119596.1 hypothetical protein [Patescibacteria group bacterium]
MPNQKAQKFKNFVGHILEPFALGVLALLFIIPTITVMNLSPITKKLKDLNVLGVNSQSSVSVTLVGGKHDVFTEENLNKNDNTYDYSTKLNKRAADSYSKPILEIKNNTEQVQTVSFYGQTLNQTQSNIRIIVDDKTYKIQDDRGQTYPQEVTVLPSSKVIVFLAIENLTGIQFSEEFDLQVKVVENL